MIRETFTNGAPARRLIQRSRISRSTFVCWFSFLGSSLGLRPITFTRSALFSPTAQAMGWEKELQLQTDEVASVSCCDDDDFCCNCRCLLLRPTCLFATSIFNGDDWWPAFVQMTGTTIFAAIVVRFCYHWRRNLLHQFMAEMHPGQQQRWFFVANVVVFCYHQRVFATSILMVMFGGHHSCNPCNEHRRWRKASTIDFLPKWKKLQPFTWKLQPYI